MSHAPVMLEEMLAALGPRDGGLYLDATFGAGGYSRAILAAAETRVIAIDRDPRARAAGEALRGAYPGRFTLAEARFGDLEGVLDTIGAGPLEGVVLDLGVSSMQLDEAARGFSFRAAGPLDMRMGGEGPSAAEAVAALTSAELESVFRVLGEEKRARRAAEAIVKAREAAPIADTARLAEIVAGAVGAGEGRIHPATRVFQALRIYINDELAELERALHAAEARLALGGRLVVVAFHSLEDRLVKLFLRERSGLAPQGSRHRPVAATERAPSFRLLRAGALQPSEAEVEENPRARSAKLRAAIRTAAPAWPTGPALAAAAEVRPLEELAS
jgi:16S rRNA (cytosine1402-N4)-methyltransferase